MKTSILVCLAIAFIAGAAGCSQGSSGWESEPSGRTAADLSAVQACTTQSQMCAANATTAAAIASCEQQLKTCLGGLLDEAGVPLPPVSFDAGVGLPPGFPFEAGSLPPIAGYDGGFPTLPTTLPDAGLPSIPSFDGGFPGSGCLQSLQTCLSGSTNPSTCAQQVATCLEQSI